MAHFSLETCLGRGYISPLVRKSAFGYDQGCPQCQDNMDILNGNLVEIYCSKIYSSEF